MGLQISGLDELRRALLALPTELRDEATAIVEGAAHGATTTITAAYPAGSSLARGMKEREDKSAFGVTVRVVNTAKLAAIYEWGTELRHTNEGWSRGRMPAAKNFVPTAIRERARMFEALIALLTRAGFVVTGAP